MRLSEEIRKYRAPDHEVGPLFVHRWSPRAMSGEPLEDEELLSLFEAARWAPSSFNNQPWRFIYARRGTPPWEVFLGLLTDRNRVWARNAAVLVVIVSKETFDHNGKPARTHSFDAGAAWENIALQGTALKLVVHGMQGFSYDRARTELGIPEGYKVEAMAAIGKRGRPEDLPAELRERERPSGRKPLADTVMEGAFAATE